jgi:hypothetical protein
MDELHLWRITGEPVGPTYEALLDLAATRCELFSFNRRVGCGLGEASGLVESALQPFRVDRQEDSPLQKEALAGLDVRFAKMFRLTPDSLRALREAPGLFSWRNPDRPESLCLYIRNGETWLHSHAPSRTAWIEDPALDLKQLLSRVPGLEAEEW